MDRAVPHLLDDLSQPTHRQVAAHWLTLYAAAGNRVPRLRELDPLAFAPALCEAWIVDVEDDGRFRFHLAGESLVDWYGRSPKGLYLEEVYPPDVLEFVIRTATGIVTRPAVCFQKAASLTRNWSLPIPMERIGLPLTDDSGRIRHLFGVTTFLNQDGHGSGPQSVNPELERWYPVVAP